MICLSGCALFSTAHVETSQGSAFAWLTQWAGQPLEASAGFDLESLRPEPRPPVVAPADLLEVTVWDLYEPGKPYTFPVRVSSQRTIEAPLLGVHSVADRTPVQVESDLAESYRTGEFLLHPRVLVRSLDPPTVKVQVAGAVLRAGFVELSRADTSVYAALVSAGGLKKSAGTQVGLVRRASATGSHPPTLASVGGSQSELTSIGIGEDSTRLDHPQQLANSLEVLSVDSGLPAQAVAAAALKPVSDDSAPTSAEDPGAGLRHRTDSGVLPPARWYDLTRSEDRQSLRDVQLVDGDEVIVKAAALPVRIGGVVQRPGAYPLPAGRPLNVWQALELAGGVRLRDASLNVTMVRPPGEGRSARRWMLTVDDYDRHPATGPLVEPGDVIHVESTTGSKLKRAVGDLWSKP